MPTPAKTDSQQILREALKLLEAEGAAGLSMRRLATVLSIQAPSLYRHYADKHALEVAMAEHGASALLRLMRRAATKEPQLPLAARAYLQFAKSRPHLYVLMMGNSTLLTGKGPGKELWNFVLSLIEPISGMKDDTAGAVALWSFLHGYADLDRTAQFGMSGPKGGFEVGLEAMAEGFKRAKG